MADFWLDLFNIVVGVIHSYRFWNHTAFFINLCLFCSNSYSIIDRFNNLVLFVPLYTRDGKSGKRGEYFKLIRSWNTALRMVWDPSHPTHTRFKGLDKSHYIELTDILTEK